jgi:hypothetical protein
VAQVDLERFSEDCKQNDQKETEVRIYGRLGRMVVIIVGVLGARAGVALLAQENGSAQKVRKAIERLHQQDVEATLSGKADDFAKFIFDDQCWLESRTVKSRLRSSIRSTVCTSSCVL